MIAAIYARKSTSQDDVADEARSVTRQVDSARAFITRKGWTLDEAHVYADDGVSGALFASRPDYQRMMRDAAAGAFEALVLFDLDRLGRDGHKTMVALHALVEVGVSIWDSSTGHQIELDSFENRLPTILKAEFAQQYREQIRKHTRAAMRQKAAAGFVTGGKLFGYDNVRVGKGQTTRVVNEAEAAVVREIYARFAEGEGLRTIASVLNGRGAPSPRAQQGRPNGWSSSSVREALQRAAYRGEVVYGRTAKAYGRELRKVYRETRREKGQIRTPEESWIRHEAEGLRIVDADLAARVDARRASWRRRVVAARAQGRAPQNAGGKYLLSGGMLVCPCGAHFEAFRPPWRPDGVYTCSAHRRKPGTCANTLALPIPATDDAVLDLVEGEALGGRFIADLLTLVDTAPDPTAHLVAERARLTVEIDNLVQSVAKGMPAEAIAPAVKAHQTELARLDAELRKPQPARPDVDALRAALEQRSAEWRATLRGEPRLARLLLRRLVEPLTLWNAAEPSAEWTEWEAAFTPALLEGLAPIQVVASPRDSEDFAVVNGLRGAIAA